MSVPSCYDTISFAVTVRVGSGVQDGPYYIEFVNAAGFFTPYQVTITNGIPSPASFSVFAAAATANPGGPATVSIMHAPGIYETGQLITDGSVTWTKLGEIGNPDIGPSCTDYSAPVVVTFGTVSPSPTPGTNTKCNDDKLGGDSEGCSSCGGPATSVGMARYTVHSQLVSLNVQDTPLRYSPPYGPGVDFAVTYNQRDTQQPARFAYSNLGPKWTFG